MAASEPQSEPSLLEKPKPPRRGMPWLAAFGFLLALAATVLTVILTGLMAAR